MEENKETYFALADTLMQRINGKWNRERETMQKYDGKILYYFSMDWLMGRTLGSMLLNMAGQNAVGELLRNPELDLNSIEEQEKDMTLGFGGLGRVAACMMDSLTTLGYPAYGCGMRYTYGLYRQKVMDGTHQALADDWLKDGNPFEVCREKETVDVQIGGDSISAIPYDMPIVGYGGRKINTLRLWAARSKETCAPDILDRKEWKNYIEKQSIPILISDVLRPREPMREGKRLCLRQQYFFVAASVRWAVKQHMEKNHDISLFHQKNVFQLNDDRSALAVAELMRILLEEYRLPWHEAWNISTLTCAYTRHSMLPEASDAWPVQLIEEEIPEIYQIIRRIDEQLISEIRKNMPDNADAAADMALIDRDLFRPGNLAAYACFAVNGVSKQHSEELKKNQLSGFCRLYPEKFHNKSNGVTHRRFLMHANPLLAQWITGKIGEAWITDPRQLENLKAYAADRKCQKEFMEIRHQNKIRLARYIEIHEGIQIDPASVFVVQAKAMYRHKRHLMFLLYIMKLYSQLKAHPQDEMLPKTFIFTGKPMISDDIEKKVIRLFYKVAGVINNDSSLNGKIKLVYLENYRVSVNELLVPAADISVQISIAGKEASGTSALKFMLNGAWTVGTRYGTNMEIAERVGENRIVLFGESKENRCENEKNRWDDIFCTFRSDENILELLKELLYYDKAVSFGLYDLPEFTRIQRDAEEKYRDQGLWAETAIWNTACSGVFSSDCTVKAYDQDVWHCMV